MKLYPMYHEARHCHKIAFYTTRIWIPMIDGFVAEETYNLDGTRPSGFIDFVKCGSCGDSMENGTLIDEDLRYRRSEPIEVDFPDATQG